MITLSTTSLKALEACPRGFKARYIERLGDKGDKAAFRGNREHAHYERMVAEPDFFPTPDPGDSPQEARTAEKAARYVQKFLTALRQKPGRLRAEVWTAVDRQWNVSKYGGPPAYARVKSDLVYASTDGKVLGVWDWKFGKWSPSDASELDETQNRLTALLMLKSRPAAQKVIGGVIYTAQQKPFPVIVTREEVEQPSREMQDLLTRMARTTSRRRSHPARSIRQHATVGAATAF
jgi:hypothetical protein